MGKWVPGTKGEEPHGKKRTGGGWIRSPGPIDAGKGGIRQEAHRSANAASWGR